MLEEKPARQAAGQNEADGREAAQALTEAAEPDTMQSPGEEVPEDEEEVRPLEDITLVFTYTREEYLRAARQFLFAAKTITGRNVGLVGLLFVFSLVYGIFGGWNTGSIVLLSLSVIVTALGCLLYFFMPAHSYKKNEKYRQQYTLTFGDRGIHFTTPTIDSQIDWVMYAEAWENTEFFYLLTGPQAYTVVPKRAFADDGQMEDFRRMMAMRLQPVKPV